MGDLRTTINHGAVSCSKLLSAGEPAREQHLCARTCCGASETPPTPTGWTGKLCHEEPASPRRWQSPTRPAPRYRESAGARLPERAGSRCLQQSCGCLSGHVGPGTPGAGRGARVGWGAHALSLRLRLIRFDVSPLGSAWACSPSFCW